MPEPLRPISNECVVNAHAWQILREIQRPVDETIAAQVALVDLLVRIEVATNDVESIPPPAKYPGTWLSATEQLIWRALERKPMLGKQIAAATGIDYGTRLKVILSNLEERGVLIHDETTGYARAPLPGAGRPEN